jgi:hypothetical protein
MRGVRGLLPVFLLQPIEILQDATARDLTAAAGPGWSRERADPPQQADRLVNRPERRAREAVLDLL